MNIGIIGLGLIGGSLGLRLQKNEHTIYGLTNNPLNKRKAEARKLANFVSCDLNILKECTLIILALPIKELINPSKALIKAIPSEAVITDVGSIKEPIINTWEKIHPLFVGSHPMAGTEMQGVDSGHINLFDNAKWVVTPTQQTNPKSLSTIKNLIQSLGCDLVEISPSTHDQSVALISHLPIFLSSCLIASANTTKNIELLNTSKKLASTGFSDTSRVGSGNPHLGLDLAHYNKKNIIKSLSMFKSHLNDIEKLISNENWDKLLEQLEKNKHSRSDFCN